MRREIILERLRLRLVTEEVKIGSALRRAVRTVISAGPERAVRIAAHALVIAGADRGLAQHVVRAGDDDLALAGAFHMRRPPREGLGHDRARGRGAAVRPSPDRIGQVIAVAHHQEADIADLEGVALPGAVDRVRTLVRINARSLRVLPDRVAPFAEPPVGLLALVRGVSIRRGVVVAGDIVDLLAAMFFEHRILTHDLAPLLVLGRIPEARIVAEIERDIPVEGRPAEGTALLRLAQRGGERLCAHRRRPKSDQAVLNAFARGLVSSDMLIADDPQIETLRLLMPYRRSRLRDRGGDWRRERHGTRLEQRPPRR